MTNRYETAFGEALYPHLSKPDYKFRPEGLYHTELLVDEKEAGSYGRGNKEFVCIS